ncbi:hypothetical protein [Rhodoferax sp.]|uniref:hypothetical protein n=1 Tax=Rhodoferax sp. TaxID=50421 RepID=UPI002604C016|nr:hypothetical protein [Rhodoferax sp.]MDD5479647.1 hypothetical protein [Rhodoferax sp.]
MFKTAVGDVVKFQVKFTLKEGLVNKQFSFLLTGTRQDQEYFDAQTDKTVKEVLIENITDWADQRLILLENNEPAPYSQEAMEYLSKKHATVIGLFWSSYLRECGCKEKN